MEIKDLEREIELLKEKVRLMERVKELESQPSWPAYPWYPYLNPTPWTDVTYGPAISDLTTTSDYIGNMENISFS